MNADKHAEHIDDVMIEISQSSYWRTQLLQAQYNVRLLISSDCSEQIPPYIQEPLRKYNLRYCVSKVTDCPDEFLEGTVTFKFEAPEHPALVRYSGNTPIDSDTAH